MSDNPVPPPADLKTLGDRLIGNWRVSGEAEGQTSWEWMDGGFFLIQRGWIRREGVEQTYLQLIGHDRMPGSEPAEAITGRLLHQHGRHADLRLRARWRRDDDLDGREGLARHLQGQLQRRRQHDRRRMGMARRRLQGDDDPRLAAE
jgi:hypothetical protein